MQRAPQVQRVLRARQAQGAEPRVLPDQVEITALQEQQVQAERQEQEQRAQQGQQV